MKLIGPHSRPFRRSLTAVAAVTLLACFIAGCKKDQGTSSPSTGPAATSQPSRDAADTLGRRARREQDLAAIAAAKSAGELKPFLAGDRPTFKAALERLAQLGDDDSVRLLGEAMASASRSAGAGGEGSAMALAMRSLADTAPRNPQALATIDKAVDKLLADGPAVAAYSHIYDTQYYEVLQQGIRGLGNSDDPAFNDKLQRIAADDKRFYTVRESAQQALIQREMRQKKAATPADRVALLLGRAEPAGALLENTWSGKSPGDKLPAAVRQATVETLILKEGWAAADPVRQKLAAATNDTDRLAMAKLLSTMLIQRLTTRPPGQGPDLADETKTLRTLLDELSKATGATLASPTLASIVDHLEIAADALADDDLNARGAALYAKLNRPRAWAGPEPKADELGVALPAGVEFIPELSKRVKTPAGPLVRAYFVSNQLPAELVRHFEKETGKKATFSPEPGPPPTSQPASGTAEASGSGDAPATGATGKTAETGRYQIALATPAELAPFLTCGVIIHASRDPYEFRPFGKVLHRGRTLFEVILCRPASNP